MKKFLILLTAGILAFGLNAKPEREGGKRGGPPEGRPSREEVMKKFDKDGDGKLSEEEKAEGLILSCVAVPGTDLVLDL